MWPSFSTLWCLRHSQISPTTSNVRRILVCESVFVLVVLFLGEIPRIEISGSKGMDIVRFFQRTQCCVRRYWSSPLLPLQSVISFLPGRIPRIHLKAIQDSQPLFFFSTKPWGGSLSVDDQWPEEVPLSGSLLLEYWAFLWVGLETLPLTTSLPDSASYLHSRSVWSFSWQHSLFPSHLPGFGALSQMPDDLHRPANWAAKPKCFSKAFWEAREKGKHDCEPWHLF